MKIVFVLLALGGCAAEVDLPAVECACDTQLVSLDEAAALCPKGVPATACERGVWTVTCADGTVSHLQIVSDENEQCSSLELVP